jgi:hypothetical protein
MNVKNRKMFRPKNAGKQAAGILASSPQLMQSVQRRYLGGNIRTRNTMLPDAAIDQTFMRPPMNLQQAAARPGSLGVRSRNTMLPDAAIDQTFMRPPVTSQQAAAGPTFFGQQTPGAKFGGSTYGGSTYGGRKIGGNTYGGMTFGGGNPTLNPLTPKGKQVVSNVGSGIASMANVLSPSSSPPKVTMSNLFPKLNADGNRELYRPGTVPDVPSFEEVMTENLGVRSDGTSPFIEDRLPFTSGEEIMNRSISSSSTTETQPKTQVDEAGTDGASTTDQGKSETGGTAKQTGNGASVVEQATAKMQANIASVDENTTPKEKLTADQATNPEVISMFTLFEADRKSPDEVDLDKVAQDARDLMGFDPEKTSKRKKEAFYMGLMQAGLAMAAGGSSNAMTNIAKGLSFGLNEYAKDIDQLNEEERENLKEFRDLKVQMIRDEKSYNLAEAGAENTWRQNNATINNQFRQAKYQAEVAQDQARIAQLNKEEEFRLRESEIAWTKASVMNSMIKDLALLDLRGQELTDQRIKNAADDAWRNRPDEQMRIAISMGWVEPDPDNKSKFRTTDKGTNVGVENFLIGKTSTAKTPTDTATESISYTEEYPGLGTATANILANTITPQMVQDEGGLDQAVALVSNKSLEEVRAARKTPVNAGTNSVAISSLGKVFQDALQNSSEGEEVRYGGKIYTIQGNSLVLQD